MALVKPAALLAGFNPDVTNHGEDSRLGPDCGQRFFPHISGPEKTVLQEGAGIHAAVRQNGAGHPGRPAHVETQFTSVFRSNRKERVAGQYISMAA